MYSCKDDILLLQNAIFTSAMMSHTSIHINSMVLIFYRAESSRFLDGKQVESSVQSHQWTKQSGCN